MRYLMMTVLGSVVLGVLFFHSSQYSGTQYLFTLLIILFFTRGLETINRADLAGRQRFDLLARINVYATVTMVAGVAVGASLYGIAGALVGYIAGSAVPAVYSFSILKGFSLRQKVQKDFLRRVWKFSFYGWLAMLVSAFVWSRMEIFFLERYWDAREVAMFTVALTFAFMIRQVAQLFSGAFVAHFSFLTGQENDELVQRQYSSATRLMAFLIIPLSFGGAAIMPALLPLLFGEEFANAIPNTVVLTATSALSFSLIGSALVYAKERSRFVALGGLVGAGLSVAAGFLIVSRFGSWEPSVQALGCRAVFDDRAGNLVYRSSPPFRISIQEHRAKLTRRSLLRSGCLVGCSYSIPGYFVSLGIAVPLGAVVYAVCVRCFGILGPDEVGQLKRFAKCAPIAVHKPFLFTLDAMVRNS